MRKYLPFILALLLVATTANGATLYEFFIDSLGYFPSRQERSEVFEAVWPGERYQGTATQNVKYLNYLKNIEPQFGATSQTPSTAAFYEDALASGISASATSFTLVRGTDKHGTALASSTYGFVLSEGDPNEELVLADCTGTTCTNVTRGVSVLTGTSTVAGAAKTHRRGDKVIISDAPILLFTTNVWRGRQNIEHLLKYSTSTEVACTSLSPNNTICEKAYIDGVAVAGASDANDTTKGIVETATNAEAAASTNLGGTGARLVLGANLATSSPYTTGNFIVVTGSDAKINTGLMATSSPWLFTGSTTFAGGATTTNFFVSGHASSSKATIGALGVGVSTSTQRNAQIAGDLQVSGACSGCGFHRIATTSNVSVNSATYANILSTQINGGLLGAGGQIVISGIVKLSTGSAGLRDITIGALYGNQSVGSSTFLGYFGTTGVTQGGQFSIVINANGLTNAQTSAVSNIGTSTPTYTAMSIDSTSNQTLILQAIMDSNVTAVFQVVDVKLFK